MNRSLCGKTDFVQSLDVDPQEALLVFPVMETGLAIQNLRQMADK